MAARQLPAFQIKGGDTVQGREVFDTRPGLGGKFLVLFTDGTRLELRDDEELVEVSYEPAATLAGARRQRVAALLGGVR